MYNENDEYLAHHGIKGQKWGVRRYQNSDGSLTDEGRRRYGFGRGARSLITQNTASRIKGGVKLGAKIGAGVGAGATAIGVGAMAASGFFNPVAAAALGATYMASFTTSGAMQGLKYGAIVGIAETQIGRNYIKQYDEGLDDFEMRDLNRKTKVNHGKKVNVVS